MFESRLTFAPKGYFHLEDFVLVQTLLHYFHPCVCWKLFLTLKARDVNLAVGKMRSTMSNKYSQEATAWIDDYKRND